MPSAAQQRDAIEPEPKLVTEGAIGLLPCRGRRIDPLNPVVPVAQATPKVRKRVLS